MVLSGRFASTQNDRRMTDTAEQLRPEGPTPPRAAIFYGWKIVAVAFVGQGLASGYMTYSFGTLVVPVIAEFGASRAQAGVTLQAALIVSALAAPLIGRALDQSSARVVMLSGALILALGYAGMASASSLWQVGLCYAVLIGVGDAMIGVLPSTTLVAKWFSERRGFALGVASIGGSVGGITIPPTAAWLIATVGWRGTFAAMSAALIVLLVPVVWWWVVDRPERLGLLPDGEVSPEADGPDEAAPSPASIGAREILGSRNFWVMSGCLGLVFSSSIVIAAHLVPYATDLGIDLQRAAFISSTLATFAIAGKLAFGAIVDRMDKRVALWLAIALKALAWATLIAEPDYATFLFAGACLGIGSGALIPVWGATVGELFGRDAFGRAMGLMLMATLPITTSGASLAGWVRDLTDSYRVVFQSYLGIFALAAFLLLFLRIPKKPSQPGDGTQPIR